MPARDQFGGDAARSTADVEDAPCIAGYMFQEEPRVLLLSLRKISDVRFDSIEPVAVVQIVSANEMPPGKKASRETDILPALTALAFCGL
jgi:hypothetical protein